MRPPGRDTIPRVKTPTTRSQAQELDTGDPIAAYRDRFALPPGRIYLDGNSLGPPMRDTEALLASTVRDQWRQELVSAWNSCGWIDLPRRVATAIAPLIGADDDEVMVADSTSVNLFKLLAAGLTMRPERRFILSEKENFPTDLYMAQGLAELLGERASLRLVERSRLAEALDDDVAILMLTQVDFRTGELLDLGDWTSAAHATGALVLCDLAHSAGALPVDLHALDVDLAVGCGYKYLNGGPGAPAFAYVARRLHDQLVSPLWGWMGHAAPFNFDSGYRPAPGVEQLQAGTPPILSLTALEHSVGLIAEIGIDRLWAKSQQLTQLFIELTAPIATKHGFEVATPRNPQHRGSQVSLRHAQGYAIVQALATDGVIGDFRAPDLLRFGFAPAYIRSVDVWDAAAVLGRVMDSGAWNRPEFYERRKVT